jgi:hypothetical protein
MQGFKNTLSAVFVKYCKLGLKLNQVLNWCFKNFGCSFEKLYCCKFLFTEIGVILRVTCNVLVMEFKKHAKFNLL